MLPFEYAVEGIKLAQETIGRHIQDVKDYFHIANTVTVDNVLDLRTYRYRWFAKRGGRLEITGEGNRMFTCSIVDGPWCQDNTYAFIVSELSSRNMLIFLDRANDRTGHRRAHP